MNSFEKLTATSQLRVLGAAPWKRGSMEILLSICLMTYRHMCLFLNNIWLSVLYFVVWNYVHVRKLQKMLGLLTTFLCTFICE